MLSDALPALVALQAGALGFPSVALGCSLVANVKEKLSFLFSGLSPVGLPGFTGLAEKMLLGFKVSDPLHCQHGYLQVVLWCRFWKNMMVGETWVSWLASVVLAMIASNLLEPEPQPHHAEHRGKAEFEMVRGEAGLFGAELVWRIESYGRSLGGTQVA